DTNPGVCGPADGGENGWGKFFYSQPSDPDMLCSSGTPTAVTTDPWRWFWSCTSAAGYNTGCSAAHAVPPACGPSGGVPTAEEPDAGSRCEWGSDPTGGITLNGSTYTWICRGWFDQSAIVNCYAPKTGGTQAATCGSAAGVASVNQPSSGL